MLDEVCELGKDEMKSLLSDQLGSWQRAVTTSDGCWHIRGFFSQNGTFVIRNWLTEALLWYGHTCMKGSDPIITNELYQGTAKGTAKSVEGYLAGVLFEKAKKVLMFLLHCITFWCVVFCVHFILAQSTLYYD